MQKVTLTLAVCALVIAIFALLRPTEPSVHAAEPDAWRSERNYPPLVFTSRATLDCSISSTKNGRQIMKTVAGQGFSFDAPMQPIKDGQIKLAGTGMHYEFNSFPVGRVPATFQALGQGDITAMKAEVAVDVKRFRQPGGAGTNIRFYAQDIDANGAYVEFTGIFVRRRDGKRFPFRVLFGSVTDGGGNVTPASAAPDTPIISKTVILGTSQRPAIVTTALYEAEEDVPALR